MRYLRELYLTANFFNITGVSEQPFENVLEIPHWWWVSTDRNDNFLKIRCIIEIGIIIKIGFLRKNEHETYH